MIDWLKVGLSLYLTLLVVGMAGQILLIGKPRDPITPGTAGCFVIFTGGVFVMLLLIWQRL